LRDVQAKETDLQAQLDQVDYALQPENIERVVEPLARPILKSRGSNVASQLENQKSKLRAQLDQLEQSRIRLEPAIATADAEVEKLQRQMELTNQKQNQSPTQTPPAQTPTETPPPE